MFLTYDELSLYLHIDTCTNTYSANPEWFLKEISVQKRHIFLYYFLLERHGGPFTWTNLNWILFQWVYMCCAKFSRNLKIQWFRRRLWIDTTALSLFSNIHWSLSVSKGMTLPLRTLESPYLTIFNGKFTWIEKQNQFTLIMILSNRQILIKEAHSSLWSMRAKTSTVKYSMGIPTLINLDHDTK